MSGADIKRRQFFNKSLERLALAASAGYEKLKSQAKEEVIQYGQFSLELVCSPFILGEGSPYKIHNYSKSIYPSDADANLMPIEIYGDGNCLYRSASVFAFGHQQGHAELRARTAVELALADFAYSDPKKLSLLRSGEDANSYAKQVATCSAGAKKVQYSSLDKTAFEQIFQEDVKETPIINTWSSMIHLHALASIFGCEIYVIYPKFNSRIRSTYNCKVLPRKDKGIPPMSIMWTRCSEMFSRAKIWQPNHFVSCLPQTLTNSSSTASARSYADVCRTKAPCSSTSTSTTSFFNMFPPATPSQPKSYPKSRSSRPKSSPPSKSSQPKFTQSKSSQPKSSPPSKSPPPMSTTSKSSQPKFTQSKSSQPKSSPSKSSQPKCTSSKSSQPKSSPPFKSTPPMSSPSKSPPPMSSPSKSSQPKFTQSKSSQPKSSPSKSSQPKCTSSKSSQPKSSPPSKSPPPMSSPSKSSQTKSTQSKSSQPKSSPSKSSQPKCTSSKSSQPKSSPPSKSPPPMSSPSKSSQTKSTQSKSSQPKSSPSKSSQPKCTSSKSSQPKSSPPPKSPPPMSSPSKSSQPKFTQSKSSQPKISPSKSSQRKCTSSKSSQPKSSPPSKSSEPRSTPSDSSQPKSSPPSKSSQSKSTPSKPCQSKASESASCMDVPPGKHFLSFQSIINCPLPLEGVSSQFYKRRGKLANKNETRNKIRRTNLKIESNGVVVKVLPLHPVTGTLSENVNAIKKKLKTTIHKTLRKSLLCSLIVGKYLLSNGPLISSQELVSIYRKECPGASKAKDKSRMSSVELWDVVSRHLNVNIIYIKGRAYLMENCGQNISHFINVVTDITDGKQVINDHIERQLGNCFNDALRYLDSKRDRDTIIALMEKITSAKFVSQRLQKEKSDTSVRNARDQLQHNLNTFKDIRQTSLTVRNDMTNIQQKNLSERLSRKRKIAEMQHTESGRGRMLKCEENENLVGLLEYAFMEGDIKERGGGGLESHPRLTDGTLYRCADSETNMKRAREFILLNSPDGFKISLSSCYNYTQNYKKNTAQAKRHHDGRNINACISLHNPPRIGVAQFVENLHWSTSNVNYIIDDAAANPEDNVVDSKDAKSIVLGDVAPVQKPGKTWKQRSGILPDHDWEQGRENAVTPMTHLFLKPCPNTLEQGNKKIKLDVTPRKPMPIDQLTVSIGEEKSLTLSLTRTGNAVVLLNPSFFERETVFRCFNELFLLLAEPSLDHLFRNPDTGSLKSNFVFVVDNGPSERPSNAMVQLCLVRFLKYLSIDKVVQVSFAEYHSKRNFAERVHPQINRVLSDHGPFNSKTIYANASQGSEQHQENMEKMADEIRIAVGRATFGGSYVRSFRGIKSEQFIFDDEEEMRTFLSLSEERKQDCDFTYTAKQCKLSKTLSCVWEINEDFTRSYSEDYSLLQKPCHGDDKTSSWRDKYTTIVYRENEKWQGIPQEKFHRQPLPDYDRYLSSGGELHYLTYERRKILQAGPWDEIPEAFLPSRILDLAIKVLPDPKESVYTSLGLLTWIPVTEVLQFYEEEKKKYEREALMDEKRNCWRNHPYYRTKGKTELIAMCNKSGLPSVGVKHELVERLALLEGEKQPKNDLKYNGELKSLPSTPRKLGEFTSGHLRSILRLHGLSTCGVKEELILRILLLKCGRQQLCFNRERKALLDLIALAKNLVLVEKRQLEFKKSPLIVRKRKFATPEDPCLSSTRPRAAASVQVAHQHKAHIKIPEECRESGDINKMFDPLIDSLTNLQSEEITSMKAQEQLMDIENIITEGVKLKVFWSQEECGDSGWDEGWFLAVVKEVNINHGSVDVEYVSEPGVIYTIKDVNEAIKEENVKIAVGSDVDQFFEIGAKVKLKTTRPAGTGSSTKQNERWYTAEVQDSCIDDDEIVIEFSCARGRTETVEVTPSFCSGRLRMVNSVY